MYLGPVGFVHARGEMPDCGQLTDGRRIETGGQGAIAGTIRNGDESEQLIRKAIFGMVKVGQSGFFERLAIRSLPARIGVSLTHAFSGDAE